MQFAEFFTADINKITVSSISGGQLQQLVRRYRSILLKLDAEGSEPEVLQSLRGLIEIKRPEIVVEVLEQTCRELNEMGFLRDIYDLHLITGNGLVDSRADLI